MDEITEIKPKDFPPLLKEITDPPKSLFLRGKLPPLEHKWLCVVGSRKYTSYGKEVCEKLISGLRGYPIVIVSGLALGMDALAHKEALSAGLKTVAVPGSGVSDKVLHPRTNFGIAKQILQDGGALLSEYEPDFKATMWSFPKRNRIMAGLSHATLLIEAAERSGTLITARLAMEYNRDVMTVPGSILSRNSFGPHLFIKNGATPVMSSQDILDTLDIKPEARNSKFESTGWRTNTQLSKNEKEVVDILSVEPLSKDELLRRLEMNTSEANIILSSMEIKGMVKETMGKISLS
jgi:DNA processing protein